MIKLVDIHHGRSEGFPTSPEAIREFYQNARVRTHFEVSRSGFALQAPQKGGDMIPPYHWVVLAMWPDRDMIKTMGDFGAVVTIAAELRGRPMTVLACRAAADPLQAFTDLVVNEVEEWVRTGRKYKGVR